MTVTQLHVQLQICMATACPATALHDNDISYGILYDSGTQVHVQYYLPFIRQVELARS